MVWFIAAAVAAIWMVFVALYALGILAFATFLIITAAIVLLQMVAAIYYFFTLKKEKPVRNDYKIEQENSASKK